MRVCVTYGSDQSQGRCINYSSYLLPVVVSYHPWYSPDRTNVFFRPAPRLPIKQNIARTSASTAGPSAYRNHPYSIPTHLVRIVVKVCSDNTQVKFTYPGRCRVSASVYYLLPYRRVPLATFQQSKDGFGGCLATLSPEEWNENDWCSGSIIDRFHCFLVSRFHVHEIMGTMYS